MGSEDGRPGWAGRRAGGKQCFGLGLIEKKEWKEVASENAEVFFLPVCGSSRLSSIIYAKEYNESNDAWNGPFQYSSTPHASSPFLAIKEAINPLCICLVGQ